MQVTGAEITPGRRGPEVGGRCVDGHLGPPDGEGRGAGCVGPQAGSGGHRTELGARSGPGRDRSAHRGDQGPSDRVGPLSGKIRLGLNGPVPARVPAEAKELVLTTVDDAVAAGFWHTWATGVWQVSDDRVHRLATGPPTRAMGTLEDLAPGGAPVHAVLADEVAEVLAVAEEWGTGRPVAPQARPSRFLCGPGVGGPLDVSACSGCPRACAARTAADTTAAPHAVAALAGLGTEQDLDLGRHPLRAGPALRVPPSSTWSRATGSPPWSRPRRPPPKCVSSSIRRC